MNAPIKRSRGKAHWFIYAKIAKAPTPTREHYERPMEDPRPRTSRAEQKRLEALRRRGLLRQGPGPSHKPCREEIKALRLVHFGILRAERVKRRKQARAA